jgi:hypothetical protein
MKLVTFVYDGSFVPIVLSQDSKLDNAHITFSKANFQDAFTELLNGIPSTQNLTLQITWQRLEVCSCKAIEVAIQFSKNHLSNELCLFIDLQ